MLGVLPVVSNRVTRPPVRSWASDPIIKAIGFSFAVGAGEVVWSLSPTEVEEPPSRRHRPAAHRAHDPSRCHERPAGWGSAV